MPWHLLPLVWSQWLPWINLDFQVRKNISKTIWLVGIVVALGFSVLYIGLGYLRESLSNSESLASNTNKGCMYYQKLPRRSFGPAAQIFLAGMVTVTLLCHNRWFNRLYHREFFHSTFPRFLTRSMQVSSLWLVFQCKPWLECHYCFYSLPSWWSLYPITITIVLIVIVNKFGGSFKTRSATDYFYRPAWSLLQVFWQVPLKISLLAKGLRFASICSSISSMVGAKSVIRDRFYPSVLPNKQTAEENR